MIAKRLALAAAAAFVTVNIWTGAPLVALWVGSRTAGPSGLSMTAVFVVVVVLLVLVLVLVYLLTRINERYDRITGRAETAQRRTSPWMRSMRGERERKRRRSVLDVVMIISVAVALVGGAVWFFAFAGSSLPGA